VIRVKLKRAVCDGMVRGEIKKVQWVVEVACDKEV